MSINFDELGNHAIVYTRDMTSIRGRRVQRLIKREFAGAEHVCIVRTGAGRTAVLGVSTTGAALVDTDGTGKFAALLVWAHGSGLAMEVRFDLLKDSLPMLSSVAVPIDELRGRAPYRTSNAHMSPGTQELLALALKKLA